MNATIWIDVEDLFDYARVNPRPSGIQRLAFEVYRALQARYASDAAGQSRVRYVRHMPAPATFREVPWADVEALFDGLCRSDTSHPRRILSAANDGAAARWAALHRSTADRPRGLDRLPERLRGPLIRLSVLQPAALRAAREFLAALLTRESPPDPPAPAVAPPADPQPDFDTLVRPGDVLLVLGAPWFDVHHGRLLARARRAHGLRTALLLYDLIPIRRPEWCDRRLVRQFAAWLEGVLPEVDALFAISRASAADVELYARQVGLTLPGPVRAVPIGTGFGPVADGAAHRGAPVDAPGDDALPSPGSYVLFVSTIEARKNHVLLFQVWRRLLDEMPADAVPTLVFAGRIGWLVADLMQQIRNADYLGGRIVIVQDPSDGDLRQLYDGCLFTVFPSLFEGWGLPVTESLALGKPCVIARGSSLPEAGGALARYFDANSVGDACRVIRATLDDPADLAAWQQRVRTEFRKVPWQATADAILHGLQAVPA